MGKYSNLSEQGERLQEILGIVPSGDPGPAFRTPRRFRRALEPNEIAGLVEAYRAGTSIKDLTIQFEINRTTVLDHLRQQDVRRRRPALNPNQLAEVCRLYETGLTSAEIAPLFAVSADSVLRALHRAGIEVRGRWRGRSLEVGHGLLALSNSY
jgi:DNA-directed RNA polymerase specialized sigma24 family protein